MISKYNIGLSNVINGYAEYEVLQAYNLLVTDYLDSLNYIFSETEYDKAQMAKGNNLSLISFILPPTLKKNLIVNRNEYHHKNYHYYDLLAHYHIYSLSFRYISKVYQLYKY